MELVTEAELEAILEAAAESDTLEFKRAMEWDVGIVKDILAMANVFDGGRIVIGVEDGTYQRQGLSKEQILTFDQERLRDVVSEYADPLVLFTVETARDRAGLQFVVINVAPFEQLPVICKRDGGRKNELRKGDVYYRPKSGRPQSSRVSNSSDLRDILEAAISRRGRRLAHLGLGPTRPARYDFDAELDGL